MRKYKALNQQVFSKDQYSIVPIRHEDRYEIMKWRNEQMYHLRQSEPLTIEKQDWYFENVVSQLFDEKQPAQILFSFLEANKCIGYGGLVHINWIDQNAEISFVMNTVLEAESYQSNWVQFLKLIEQVAFIELSLHKLYVYAFDLRPHLYESLEANTYFFDARLSEHCFYDGDFIDVVIYSKLNI